MRFSKVWTIASKDFKIFRNKKGILYSLIGFQIFVSIGLPLIIQFASTKTGSFSADLIPRLINAFSFWFVIGAAIFPTTIASYSLVGEKLEKSLEPLLATPVTDEEILMGKSLAAFIPTIFSIYIGAIIFMSLIDIFSYKELLFLYFPNWNIAVILLILSPLACILDIGFNIIISSRVNDTRSAQQLGMLMILPFATIYVLSEMNIILLTINNLLIISSIVLMIDIILFYIVKNTFRREEILTKWK